MFKGFVLFIALLPFSSFAQVSISGKVVSRDDGKAVAAASVFLSNSSIGGKTDNGGNFKLINARPGTYDLVVSSIGFRTYSQAIIVSDKDISLPPISLAAQTIILGEVKINPKTDPNREQNLRWFKDEFLGVSDFANDCKIINPQILDLEYDEKAGILTASSADFLNIENDALGYRIKYLLKHFQLNNSPGAAVHVNYEGSVLFEEMKGTATQKRRWQRHRHQAYQGSMMHFLRSALTGTLKQEGFRAIRLRKFENPERPADSLIEAKIKQCRDLKLRGAPIPDSLSFWLSKAKLPKIVSSLADTPLHTNDIIKQAQQPGLFAFGFGNTNDVLFVTYNKDGDFYTGAKATVVDDPHNKENNRVEFQAPYVFFDSNGWITIPGSLVMSGVWGRNRMAELLPVDYSSPQKVAALSGAIAGSGRASDSISSNVSASFEKAYLQSDKPYYAAGDTIYFKAYVTKGELHQLSDISGVLHVDLVNTSGKIDQSIKLKIDSGLAWGDFALPDSLPGGNYRIRAYTQWMRNNGDAGFFDKVIPIASLKSKRVPESLVRRPGHQGDLKPDVQFFPEGGSLLAGIRSKVAFKAVGTNGLGLDVKGTVMDNDGKEVLSFASAHLGMGSFYLIPAEGKTYRAKLSFAGGEQMVTELPKAVSSGIVLSVNNDSLPAAGIRVIADAAFYNAHKDKPYKLLVHSANHLITVNLRLNSPEITLQVLKRKLHTGIAVVTLLSAQNEPLSERLLFIQNYDHLALQINSSKPTYAGREKAIINLKALDRRGKPAEGHFSVSVIDESKVPEIDINAGNILTHFLLTSDLKGYVEQPAYYFNDTSATAAKNLDLLMLTQGYRQFAWQAVRDTAARLLTYQPEQGIEIAGEVKSLFGRPVSNGTVYLIPQFKGPVPSSTTDDKGMFRFTNLSFSDTAHFVLSAVNAKGKNSTTIAYLPQQNQPAVAIYPPQDVDEATMLPLLTNDKLQQDELVKFGHVKGIMLKEVKIKEKKPDDDYRTQSLAGAGHADQVMHADEIEKFGGQLSASLNGRLLGIVFFGGVPYLNTGRGPMLVIIDGVESHTTKQGESVGNNIDLISLQDVETVEVLKYASASIYGMQGGNGVLVITTKQGGGRSIKDIASSGVLPIAPMGFYKARQFYSPKYENKEVGIKARDLRSTIYWQPELKTNQDGAGSFEYFNADGTGTFKVIIEGIDEDGNIGRQVYEYMVQ